MIYRPFHPTVRGEKIWGYWYWLDGKKKRVFTNPETGKPFATRAEVERVIQRLAAEQPSRGSGAATIGAIGMFMFLATSDWARRQARRRDGRPLSAQTLREHECNFRLHIEPRLGKKVASETDEQEIQEFLYEQDMSNRSRRNVAWTLHEILEEAVYKRLLKRAPVIALPSKKSKKPSVPTLEELYRLFPTDRKELDAIWAPGNKKREALEDRLALAGCAATLFFGGLRPQEGRAIAPGNLHRESGILLVTAQIDSDGNVLEYVKMGDDRDRRYRGTILIDRAVQVIEHWLPYAKDEKLLFTYQGRPIRPELLHARLRSAVTKAQIPTEGRRFTPYSGRYTFDSVVRPLLPSWILMLLMGHVDPAMSERYDIPFLLQRMKQLEPEYKQQINSAFEGKRLASSSRGTA